MSIPKKRTKKKDFYKEVEKSIKKRGIPTTRQEIKMFKDRHKFEGVVPKYQEPRPVEIPGEPSPKAKELLKQGKKVYFL